MTKSMDSRTLLTNTIRGLFATAKTTMYYVTQNGRDDAPGVNAIADCEKLAKSEVMVTPIRMQDAHDAAREVVIDAIERLEAQRDLDRVYAANLKIAEDDQLRGAVLSALSTIANHGEYYTVPKASGPIYNAAQKASGLMRIEKTPAEVNEARVDDGRPVHPWTIKLTDDGYAMFCAIDRLERDEVTVDSVLDKVREDAPETLAAQTIEGALAESAAASDPGAQVETKPG